MSDRFYVSLSGTCSEADLHSVLDRMSAVVAQVADAGAGTTVLDGLSLSFTRDTEERTETTDVPLPPPIVPDPFPATAPPASEPPAPPIDADAGLHAAPEGLS